MRIILYSLGLLLLCLQFGCGGSEPAPPPGALTGQWVEAAPAAQPVWQEGGDLVRWPTRLLTLRDDHTFLYEEGAPENWVKGDYEVVNNELHFSRVQRHGTVTALANAVVSYVVMGDTLGVVEETLDEDRVLQLTRVSPAIPPVLAHEWIAARRIASQGGDLPLSASIRILVAENGTLEQSCYLPSTKQLTTAGGRVLLTTTGSLALYLGASGAFPGQVDILGAYTVQSGAFTVRAPDGSRLCFVSRTAPDPRLAVDWVFTSSGDTATLSLRPDGSYTHTVNGVTTTGTWRAYTDGYLCLISATAQHTYTWELWMQATNRILRLGEWVPMGGGESEYREFSWQHWETP